MEAMARSYLWWLGPGVDRDLEEHVWNCHDCQAMKNSPAQLKWGETHMHAHHPLSNDLAERLVQTFKKAMKAGANSTQMLDQRRP